MDNKKIGKFLAELRKEKGVTQEQVGYELMTSRENISKWERGINMPTPDSLMLLSKYYGVTVNEILLGERKTEENKEQIENVSVEVMKEGNKRVKTVLKKFTILISFMVIAFLVYYFINTYNTIKVYTVGAVSDNFYVKDGLAIFSKGKSYLRIGTIESKSDFKYDSFEIFVKNKNKEKTVFVSNDDNYTLISDNGYDEIFRYKNLSNIEKNTYIKINYQDKEDIIKLTFQRDMTNNLLVTDTEADIISNKNVQEYNQNDIQKLENYIKGNWAYDEVGAEYVYSGEQNNIKYKLSYHSNSKVLKIEEYTNISKIIEINLIRKTLFYSEEDSEMLNEKYRYDLKSKKCIKGTCDDKQIKNYLDNYLHKYIK